MALTWITWPLLLLISVFTLQMVAVSGTTPTANTTTSISTTNANNSDTTASQSSPTNVTSDNPGTSDETSTSTSNASSSTASTSPGTTSSTRSSSAAATSSPTSPASNITPTSSSNSTASTPSESSSASPIIDTTPTNNNGSKITLEPWQILALVIGVPVGGVIVLIVIIVIIVACCRRCKRRKAADEESKALERVTAPNGDLYTQVVVKGRGFQAIEMTPVKASNGQEYRRLSMDIPSDVTYEARSTKGTQSALITSTDYESLQELSLEGESTQAKETKICRESGETQPVEKAAEDVRESAYANPLAGRDDEVEYENCSDYLNGNGGDGKVSKDAPEANKTTQRPSSKLEIVSLKKEKSPVADKKEQSLKNPSRDATSTYDTTAERPCAQDENPAAPRPDSDIYENASVVHDVNKGSTRQQESMPDGQAKRDSRAGDDVVVAKEGESSQRPTSKDSSEDLLEDNVLYESSRDVQEYMNNVAV